MEKISYILHDLLEKKGLSLYKKNRMLALCWHEIAGKKISSISRPLKLEKGNLIIAVKDSTWCHHLNFFRQELVTRLNKKFPDLKIRGIKFNVLNYWQEEAPPKKDEDEPLPGLEEAKKNGLSLSKAEKKLLDEVDTNLKEIGDKILHECIRNVVEKDLYLKAERKRKKLPACKLCRQEATKRLMEEGLCYFCRRRALNLYNKLEKIWYRTPWLSFSELKNVVPDLTAPFYNYIKEQFLSSLKKRIDSLQKQGVSEETENEIRQYLGMYIMNKCSLPPQKVREEDIKNISADFPQIALFYFSNTTD